jgi:hypothetical protein
MQTVTYKHSFCKIVSYVFLCAAFDTVQLHFSILYIFPKHWLRVSENRVLKKVFGPKRDEVTGEWRRLRNKELYDLYCTTNIIQVIITRIRWAGHVARMGDMRCVYRVLVGKPEGKRRLRRNRRTWKGNIKKGLGRRFD